MKSKFQISILAVIAAALMPLAAAGQIAPERAPSEGPQAPTYKWEAFAMAGYTSLNQVNQSRYGLIGGRAGATRDFGKHFGITAIGSYYKPPTGKSTQTHPGNPGDPSVYSGLAGPEFRATIYGNFDGFLHGLLGVEHTGGEHMTPNISFAGGFGGGLVYNLSQHWALRASGDRVGASFSLNNNSPQLNYSPHLHWNARGEFGVVYRF
ncbi:MAG: hypothetical protein WA802_04460 [Terracidiphilus sp.]